MAELLFKNVSKQYPGGGKAVHDLSLRVQSGEFFVLLGPAGSGKSTLLRMAAGLEDVTAGELYLDGKLQNDVPAKERNVAMVFRQSELFAQQTVAENIAYGLKLRKFPAELIEERVKAAAEILGLTDLLSRRPKTLSGSERQRVVLARTVVREPALCLFDDPLASFDARLRAELRTLLSKLQARLKTTYLYATDDPLEAMMLGTRIAVLRNGFLQQADTPQNLYDYPANLFVATAIGAPQINLFRARLCREGEKTAVLLPCGAKILLPGATAARLKDAAAYADTDRPVVFGIRAEDVHGEELFLSSSPDTAFRARVISVEPQGAETFAVCDLDLSAESASVTAGATQLSVRLSPRAAVKCGDVLDLAFDARHVQLFDAETERSLLARDEKYEAIPAYAEEADMLPPTPQEMREAEEAAKPAKPQKGRKPHGGR